MSTQRWWAPQRATLEPDAVVLSLLKPDDNGNSDLGTTLLAAHRAGAAACEAVAKGAVPSEAGLITSLATARQNLADHMVTAVSKSMEPTYAGLLVRDVLDEAEQGAVDLFRTAVAKGVSPPLAAQRAGAVYGVPFRQLGTYAALAVDPKTNPLALTDAADRTLLGYFAKVAESEDTGQVVTFSKAPAHVRPMAQTEERWEEHEHPRGPDGKFVNAPPDTAAPVDDALESPPTPGSLAWVRQKLGLESNAPTRVADVRTPAPTRAPQREQRVARQARTARVARTAPEQTRPAAERKKLVRTKPERTLSRKELTRALEQLDNGRLDRALEQSGRSTALSVSMTPDLLKVPDPGGDPDDYRYLDVPVSVVASGAVAEALRMRMIDQAESFADSGTRVFRIGHLLGQATGQHEATSEDESKVAIETAAEQAWDIALHPPEAHMAEATAPDVETIHPDDINIDDHQSVQAFMNYLEQKKHEAATKVLPSGRRVLDPDELQHVHVLEDYRPVGAERYDEEGRLLNDTDYHVVHYRGTDPHNPHQRAMPTVDEFVILNSARGAVEGVGQHVELVLDPNQAYQVVGRAEKFFDAENQVIVRRWHLAAVDEDELGDLMGGIGKALESAQAVVFEQLHPRDEEGRFAPASERQTLVAPTATPTRQARTARTTRQARTARTLERQAPAALPRRQLTRNLERTVARSEATRALSRELLARREAARRPADPDLPELSDARAYKVMNERHLAHVLDFADGDLADLETPGQSITVYGPGRRILAEHGEQRVESLKQRLAMNVDQALVEQGSIATKSLGSVGIGALGQGVGLAQAISDAFERNPDVDQVELVRHGDRLHLYGNSHPVKHQVIIEHDFDVDWDAPVEIELIGEYRARDIVMSTSEGRETLMNIDDLLGQGGEGVVPNPSVQLFRITSPKVRRYRAGNA